MNNPSINNDPNAIAKQFIEFYYKAIDSNDANTLAQVFRDESSLSFEGDRFVGRQPIVNKLTSLGLPVGQVLRRHTSIDAQFSCLGSGALVIMVLGEWMKQQYQEIFQLVPSQPNTGNYYIHNCITRITLANPFNVPPEASELAKGFIQHYYRLYDGGYAQRQQLHSMYTPTSVVDYEGNRLVGPQQIMEKFVGNAAEETPGLPLVYHDPSMSCDIQLIKGLDIVLIMLVGTVFVDNTLDERIGQMKHEKPLKFAQMFLISKQGTSYIVGNQIFRLNYG